MEALIKEQDELLAGKGKRRRGEGGVEFKVV